MDIIIIDKYLRDRYSTQIHNSTLKYEYHGVGHFLSVYGKHDYTHKIVCTQDDPFEHRP